jgi:hypothetical protein
MRRDTGSQLVRKAKALVAGDERETQGTRPLQQQKVAAPHLTASQGANEDR